MFAKAIKDHVLDDRNDGGLQWQGGQLLGAAVVLGKKIAHPECQRSQNSVAGKIDLAAVEQFAETGFGHRLKQSVLIRVMEIERGPVHTRLYRDIADGNIGEVLSIQQIDESSLQHLASAADAWISRFRTNMLGLGRRFHLGSG